jgi:hypothetical protein
MRRSVIVFIACALMFVGGVALAGAWPMGGVALTLIGALGVFGFMIYAYVWAWRHNQGDFLTPGNAHRQVRKEREAAAAKGEEKP